MCRTLTSENTWFSSHLAASPAETERESENPLKNSLFAGPYLSEPVICDDEFTKALFLLWEHLQLIEEVRKILLKYAGNTVVLEKNLPALKNAAQRGLPLALSLL